MKRALLKEIRNRLPFDIRAEALAVELLHQYEDFEHLHQFLLSPRHPGKRRIGKEVQEISPAAYSDLKQWYNCELEVSRLSSADRLPRMLYYNTQQKAPSAQKEVEQLQEQRQAARDFFLPFDQALAFPLMEIEYWEREAVTRLPAQLVDFWGLRPYEDMLSPRQMALLLYIIPQAERIAGDMKLLRDLIAFFTAYPVELLEKPPADMPFEGGQNQEMGQMSLGINAIIGGSFNSGMKNYQISISEIPPEEIDDFLPGGKKRQLLENVIFSYFMPLEIDWDLLFFTAKRESPFTLSSESTNCILGYTTNI